MSLFLLAKQGDQTPKSPSRENRPCSGTNPAFFPRALSLNFGSSFSGEAPLDAFFAAGYTKESMVDLIMVIADKIVMNYRHNLTKIPVDFPAAPSIEN